MEQAGCCIAIQHVAGPLVEACRGAGQGAGGARGFGRAAPTGAQGRERHGAPRQGRAGARGRWASGHAQAGGTVPTKRPVGACDTALGWPRHGHARAAWEQPMRAGWAKLVHYAHGSVLTQFLTQFLLSTVPESIFGHCSKKIN